MRVAAIPVTLQREGAVAVEQLAHSDVDQVRGPRVLDRAERDRRGDDQRRQADGRGRYVDERPEVNARDRCQTDAPPLLGALEHDVEDSRTGDQQQGDRRQAEEPERGGVRKDHG